MIAMKRTFFATVTILLAAICAHASISESKIKKFINRYDVADTVLKAENPLEFWSLLTATNPEYAKAAKSLAGRGDKDLKKTLTAILNDARLFYVDVPVKTDATPLADRISDKLGLQMLLPSYSITVTDETDFATYGYPNGMIFMTGALFDEAKADTASLTALMAAESVHFALQHAYAHAKWEKSRRKKHGILAGAIGAAFLATAAVVSSAADTPEIVDFGGNVMNHAINSPIEPKHPTDYTPGQIVEADIVAFRLMQLIYGSGNPYIDALRRYGYTMECFMPTDSKDYISVGDRIRILEYLRDEPDVRRNVKAKNRLPEIVPVEFKILRPAPKD